MNVGKLTVVKGDVRSPQFTKENELAIIPHCCNNLGVMGAGVALALKMKWAKVFDQYKKMESESPNYGLTNRLGENSYASVEDNIIVVNMIGQNGVVSDNNSIPVKYWALQRCMEAVRSELLPHINCTLDYDGMTPVIHTPMFGSDLAGGKWEFILELIREQWLEYGLDVVVYEFE